MRVIIRRRALLSRRCLLFRSELDAGDFHPGQFAAMADGPVITFAPAIFEGDDFLVLALLDHFASDTGARKSTGCRGLDSSPSACMSTSSKVIFCARFTCEQIHIDRVAFCDAILSAACFDNCVSHGLGKSRRKSHGVRLFDKRKSRLPGRGWHRAANRPLLLGLDRVSPTSPYSVPATSRVISPLAGCAS